MLNANGLSPNSQVWARKDPAGGGSEWVLATVAADGGSAKGRATSDTVQVFFPGAKRRKRMSSTDVVPNSVKVVLRPLVGSGSGVNRFKYAKEEILAGDEMLLADDQEDKENQKKGRLRKSLGTKEKIKIENAEGEEAGEVTINNDEVSEYEKIRLKNIAQRQEMFAKLKADMIALKQDMAPKPKPKCGVNRAKNFLMYSSRKERVVTRSRRNSAGCSEPSSGSNSGASTPIKRKRLWEEMSDFSESEDEDTPKRTYVRNPNPGMWMKDPNVNILMPEDITDEMLANIADRVSDKVYSQDGTTCHQCRQKTTDVKTVCRSGNCAGVRGYFCGVCLLNRYGQYAREALKDPNWMCPPCMDVCNCSICRNRMGKGATGPITYLAQAKGFKCVKDYLESMKKKKGTDEFDDDDE